MTRLEHLQNVADDYGVSLDTVLAVASVLGEEEDHDALIVMVEDLSLLETAPLQERFSFL